MGALTLRDEASGKLGRRLPVVDSAWHPNRHTLAGALESRASPTHPGLASWLYGCKGARTLRARLVAHRKPLLYPLSYGGVAPVYMNIVAHRRSSRPHQTGGSLRAPDGPANST